MAKASKQSKSDTALVIVAYAPNDNAFVGYYTRIGSLAPNPHRADVYTSDTVNAGLAKAQREWEAWGYLWTSEPAPKELKVRA